MYKSRGYKGSATTRRRYAANSALNKARAILRKRNSGLMAPAATRGFYGLFNSRGRDELKVIDEPSIGGTFPIGGILVLLNGVVQGTDYTQRIGRKITLKSLLFRIGIIPGATTPNGDIVRVLIVYDSQTNAATPAITDIINNALYNEPMNLNNRDRFKVLADKFVTIGAATYTAGNITGGCASPVQLKIYKKMSMEEIFGATGGTVGSINTGGVFALLISLNNNTTAYQINSRMRFIDS